MTRPSIRIGKLSSKGIMYPWEPGYVSSMHSSFSELVDILDALMSDLDDASGEVMLDVLQPTFEKSKTYCPKKTGALVNSGYLAITSFRGNARVEMGYGRGGQPFYAVLVHENMEAHHEAPTRAKWLQAAMMEDLGSMFQSLGREYKDVLGTS